MSSIFDMEDGDFLMKMSDNMMMDSEGHLMQSFGSGMAMDMDTGELHMTMRGSGSLFDEDDD